MIFGLNETGEEGCLYLRRAIVHHLSVWDCYLFQYSAINLMKTNPLYTENIILFCISGILLHTINSPDSTTAVKICSKRGLGLVLAS